MSTEFITVMFYALLEYKGFSTKKQHKICMFPMGQINLCCCQCRFKDETIEVEDRNKS